MNHVGKALMIGGLGIASLLNLSPSVAKTALPYPGTLPFAVSKYVKTDGRCAHLPKAPCTQITVAYPQFHPSSTPTSTAIDAINNHIQQLLLQKAANDRPPQDIESAMSQFIRDYHAAVKEFPRQGVWADEKQVEVKTNQPHLLSLQFSHYFYTGGAHPNSSRTYWNFNPKTGTLIQLSDVLVKGYAPKLNAIAEQHFRAVKALSPSTSLNKAGFWFENDKFQVNDNFLIAPEGLIFFFNTYEIGPYVVGPTEIKIPYTELEELIKDQTFLPTP
ncbi:DUF3298 and DUF4163 domain-containing protein [Acaryochloris sp. IP29b_bin.137]|uniref:DUF3298 and DUF4163 domain-containing protein n=1 Tax=Acaryochloris sp. IP29b_bin.137 TaxID=2969217 RepID=UPI0026181A5F|nr:DUF3298 and DUF4163 domain-containing protein [Acaryochloris sp. IP29b_bin.137]